MGEFAASVFSNSVREAMKEFSNSIMGTPQFEAWEQKLRDVANDRKALGLAQQIRHLQVDIRQEATREPVVSGRQHRLEGLLASYEALPTVIEFRLAEAQFRSLCVEANLAVSEGLGIDFASHCARGCCG
jgi:cell fate (sporulation/competence/biofilm development) regulator YlbF (YheA/YmcA/DUF963 family)